MANPHDTKGPEGGESSQPATGDLAARIARAKAERPSAKLRADGGNAGFSGANQAYRLVAEFVAPIIVGAALGYGIDLLVGTKPWAMIVLLLIGFAAGVMNMARTAKKMNDATAVPPGVPDDDDDD